MLIYNNKAILLDDADIEYLNDDQIIFVSLDGNNFLLSFDTKGKNFQT